MGTRIHRIGSQLNFFLIIGGVGELLDSYFLITLLIFSEIIGSECSRDFPPPSRDTPSEAGFARVCGH